MKTKKYIKSIDRDNADIEIENGEFVKMGPFINEATGKWHSKNPNMPGGIPYKSNGDFETIIVSNSKDMPVTDEGLLKMYGAEKEKGKVTYADLMRKKKLSTHKDIAILFDPFSTEDEKRTALYNVYNKNDKANMLIAAQELSKGKLPPLSTIGSIRKRGINPDEIIPVNEMGGINPEQIIPTGMQSYEDMMPQEAPRMKRGGKKYGYGGPVDDFDLFNQIKANLNLPEEYKNKSNSELLGDYGQQLIDIYNHFTDNPRELDKLYNDWKGSQSVKDNNFDISKDKFLKQYILWLYSKQAFKTTGEGGKDWSGKQAGSKSLSGQELNKRNAKASGYSETFGDFAGLSRENLANNIKFYQTMDVAMNRYAKDYSGDDISITTNDYSTEDDASAAGLESSTEQSGRQGVSIIDGFFGQRTADFLPYITQKKKDGQEENNPMDIEHVQEYNPPYDDRWFIQDLNNLRFARRNLANVYKSPQMLPEYQAVGMQPHYHDYRNLAYQAASNAASVASAAGMTSDPTARVAMANSLADRVNTATANALSQEQNQNVRIANQFEGSNAQIANNLAAQRASLAKKYFDEGVINEQQYRNSLTKANEEITKTLNKGLSNVQVRELLRKNNYTLTPDGRIIYTGDDKDIEPQVARKDDTLSLIDTLMGFPYNIPADKAAQIVLDSKKSVSGRTNLNDLAKYYGQ